MKKPNIDKIGEALIAEAGKLDFSPQEARVFIRTLRQLSHGQPVTQKALSEIAAQENMSGDAANAAMDWVAERDKEGRIVGLAGLSTNTWNHKFKVNGTALTTWCALDTLFLPQILRKTAEIESIDPVNKMPIRLTIAPDKVERYSPRGAILSIVIPNTTKKGLESAEEIRKAFCSFSRYFSAEETAREWFSERNMEPVLLSLDEGHRLGYLWFENIIEYA